MIRTSFVLILLLLLAAGCSEQPRVVLYCAQDRDFAELVLGGFAEQTHIPVEVKFDTEANKSVSIVEELRREADRPRCDVHWNNEILGTIRLQQLGLLEEYRSPNAEPFPAWSKAEDGTWQAFASRARILIVNTELVAAADRPTSLFDLLDPRWRSEIALAKPLFGTTATHAVCLFDTLGNDAATRFFQDLRGNDVHICAGNKQVAEGVGTGRYAFGLTDTDDAMLEVEAGRPVTIVFPDRQGHPDHPELGTLFIPNTVALVKGGPNPEAGRRLIDYLLSAENERRLAEGGGHQIPLNPNVEASLPPQLLRPEQIEHVMEVDFESAAERWDEAQAVLRGLFAE